MKKKFILPAAFALTLHAFLLFGLTGKTPPAVAAAAPAPFVPTRTPETRAASFARLARSR